MKYKIEKNVPIATRVTGCNKFPFNDMKVDDSFFVKNKSEAKSAKSYVYNYGAKNKKKFTIRTVDGGVRIWRIK